MHFIPIPVKHYFSKPSETARASISAQRQPAFCIICLFRTHTVRSLFSTKQPVSDGRQNIPTKETPSCKKPSFSSPACSPQPPKPHQTFPACAPKWAIGTPCATTPAPAAWQAITMTVRTMPYPSCSPAPPAKTPPPPRRFRLSKNAKHPPPAPKPTTPAANCF